MKLDPRLKKLYGSLKKIDSVDDLETLSAGDAVNVKNSAPHIIEKYDSGQLHTYSAAFLDGVKVTVFDLQYVSVMGNRIVPACFGDSEFLEPGAGEEYKTRARRLREYGLML